MLIVFLAFFVGIIVCFFLAKLIVDKVPVKVHPVISILLLAVAALLAYLIYDGVMSPIKFNKAKVKRYKPVIENLKMIRDAEIAHKEVTGDFTKDKAKLIAFIDTAKFAITNVRNETYTETLPGGITIDKERRVVDTVGFEPVKKNFDGRDYKNMFKVPGANSEFDIETGYVEKIQGIRSPVFLVKVDKNVVLEGLDKNLIKQEREQFGGPEVSGEFISVGSLDDVKVNGNWPPSYDTAEERKENEG